MMKDQFDHHTLGTAQQKNVDRLREEAKSLARSIGDCCLVSRETSLALTNLEQCLMWANKAIAIHGTNEESAD